jgi:CspA family cold shock protein
MAKPDSWRQRPTRKRAFDDDFVPDTVRSPPIPSFSSPRPGPVASGPELEAVVKWFNAEKGFGFVDLADGSGDAFLHISILSGAGATTVAPGAKLKVRLGQGPKGPQVTEVTDIRAGEAPAAPAFRSAPRASGPSRDFSTGPSIDTRGTVKWYNPQKGFGFVAPDGGGKDVFVHATALERGGVSGLAEGQTVRMQVVQGKKGPEAASISAE